jgi:hypothetical protein
MTVAGSPTGICRLGDRRRITSSQLSMSIRRGFQFASSFAADPEKSPSSRMRNGASGERGRTCGCSRVRTDKFTDVTIVFRWGISIGNLPSWDGWKCGPIDLGWNRAAQADQRLRSVRPCQCAGPDDLLGGHAHGTSCGSGWQLIPGNASRQPVTSRFARPLGSTILAERSYTKRIMRMATRPWEAWAVAEPSFAQPM